MIHQHFLRKLSMRFSYSIIPCAMDGSSGMLWRRIDRREFQRTSPSVRNIVPCTTRHKNNISCTKIVPGVQPFFTTPHPDDCFPFFHTDKLICIRVHFHTDITANGNTH